MRWGKKGALKLYGTGRRPEFDPRESDGSQLFRSNSEQRESLRRSPTAARARKTGSLVFWQWWNEMGPEGFQRSDVYLRTATLSMRKEWATFDYLKMPDYRWGIFLAEPVPDRRIAFGEHKGEPVWREVPGEHRGC